jgi:hypothetical protein
MREAREAANQVADICANAEVADAAGVDDDMRN